MAKILVERVPFPIDSVQIHIQYLDFWNEKVKLSVESARDLARQINVVLSMPYPPSGVQKTGRQG